MKKIKRIAIFPAREGSKRIKSKNIKNFFGKPIIYYSLEAAKNSNLFDKIHVSTDSKNIANIVKNYGVNTEFLRPKKLANDYVGILKVLEFVIKKYKDLGQDFDVACLIFPCAPLITEKDLKNAYKIFLKNKSNFPVLSVAKFSHPIEWALEIKKNNFLESLDKPAFMKRSQDFKEKYFDTGNFTFFPVKKIPNILLEEEKKPYKNYIPYVVDRIKGIDIDNVDDLLLAKKVFKFFNKNKKK